jgi:hypothetical protein
MNAIAAYALSMGAILGLVPQTVVAGNIGPPDRVSQQSVANERPTAVVPNATAEKYRWVIPKLPKDLNNIEKSKFTVGFIKHEKYVAIQLDADEPNTGSWVLLIIAKINADQSYDPISVKKFYPSDAPSIRIEKNSIYMRGETAHHGNYFVERQFKLRNGVFCLVGATGQSITLSQPENRPKPDRWKGETLEIWEGSSSNYLNSEAIHWELALRGGSNSKATRNAREGFNEGLIPAKAIKRYTRLKPTKLVTLEEPINGEMDKK